MEKYLSLKTLLSQQHHISNSFKMCKPYYKMSHLKKVRLITHGMVNDYFQSSPG